MAGQEDAEVGELYTPHGTILGLKKRPQRDPDFSFIFRDRRNGFFEGDSVHIWWDEMVYMNPQRQVYRMYVTEGLVNLGVTSSRPLNLIDTFQEAYSTWLARKVLE